MRVLGITLLCGPILLSMPVSFANASSAGTGSSTSVSAVVGETKPSTSVSTAIAESKPNTSVPAAVKETKPSTSAPAAAETKSSAPAPSAPTTAAPNTSLSTPKAVAATNTDASTDNEALRAELQDLVNQGNNAVANAHLYTEDSIAKLQTTLSNAQYCLDYNLDYSIYITSMKRALGALVLVPTEPSTTEPSTTEPSTTEPSTTEPSTTEPSTTEPSTTEPSTTEPSTTEPSTTEPSTTEPSTTEPSTTEPSTTEPSTTEPSTSKPSIKVSDQTMYVNDKLTEEDILSWATFENAEGLNVGYEVVGEPIQVTVLGNTLVKSGTHQIRFYIEGTDASGEKIDISKTITLTILDAKENINNKENGISNPEVNGGTTISKINESNTASKAPNNTAIKKQKSIPVATKHIDPVKTLPKTGEENSKSFVAFGVGLLGISLYLAFKRKKTII